METINKRESRLWRLGKRAQIFTMITILLLFLVFAAFSAHTYLSQQQAAYVRISSMENFLFELEKSLQRENYIFGFRTLFSAEDYISRTGNYVPSIDRLFNESFFNASISGNNSIILNDTSFSALLTSINSKASKLNVNITISNAKIKAYQQDPWNVAITLTFNMTMTDDSNLSSWSRVENITSYVEIEGFEDPLYMVNTNSKVSYLINRSEYYNGTKVTNLTGHLQGHRYIAHTDAPSFLGRLTGSLNADPLGIESLVDLSAVDYAGLPTKQKSIVDYIYFSYIFVES